MSRTVDHRIVEMRFDNKQFESGAKETMSTLTRLKEALKFPESGKALEDLGKATKNISLDGIAAGVEALERRFSTFGIVGMRVIENLTDGFMNKLTSAVNFATDAIISGGIKRAMNIENAHFQLQALLKDEAKVQAVMDNAMEAVDGTAYAYDEAAKAASQFAASGIQAGDAMLGALKGITGVAAMTNSSFEDISRIFTTVAGNGRLMGDQLLQLSGRGLNAASTISDYYRQVLGKASMTEAKIREMVSKGQISFKTFSDAMTWAFGDSAKRANETFTGAMSNMKSALARIGAGFVSPLVEQNGELVQLFNALRIKINDVKAALVFDEQRSAISGLRDVTGMTKDELSDMFKTIKENGRVSIDNLDMLTDKGADAYGALTKYINGVSNGSIRATYATKTALTNLTDGMEVSIEDVKRFVKEGKIDLNAFTSAMETEFGKEKTLSKQFTDWFQDHIHAIVVAINSADMTKPMEIFYYWVETIKNLAKGILSVISPIRQAFSDVFPAMSADSIIAFSEAVELLTSRMRLSESSAQNLHDAFEGLFNVLKLGVDIFFALFGAIIPINKPVIEMSGGFLGLAGSMGRGLTVFTKMIRSCELLKKAFNVLSKGINLGIEFLTKLIRAGKDFVSTLSKMEGVRRFSDAILNAFRKLGVKASPYIEKLIDKIGDLFTSLFNLESINLDAVATGISNALGKLALKIENFSFQTLVDSFDSLKAKIKELSDLAMSNKGFATFVNNFKKYAEELKEAFTFDNLLNNIEKFMDVFGKFFNWIKNTFSSSFEDFNVGSALAVGGGVGIIYAMIEAAKGFRSLSRAVTSIPELFGSMRSTLIAYQKELKADALLKTAGAIAVLAGALVLLSFADTERLFSASTALAMIAGTLMLGVSMLLDAVNKTRVLNDGLKAFSKGINNFAKAVKWKAIGSAVKKIGETMLMMAGSIVLLGIFYKKDPVAFKEALKAIEEIGVIIAAIVMVMTVASNFTKDAKAFKNIASSLLMATASLMLIILAISKLMKMKVPTDYGLKVGILSDIIGSMAKLTLALGAAARISGGKQLPKMAGAIISLAVLMVGTVSAIKTLFKMQLPDDYQKKLNILNGIFDSFYAMLIVMGITAKIAGGNGLKAAGTILAMTLFLTVIVGALFVLTLLPGDKMMKGAIALGGILVALGVALYGTTSVTDKNAYKAVLAMGLMVGVLTASLAVLTMIPWKKLAISTASLGIVLMAMANNFKEISKMDSAKSLIGIMGMISATLTIAYALYTLSEQPWDGLLAASVSMGIVLMTLSDSFQKVLSKNWSKDNLKNIETFLLMTLALAPVGVALGLLANQPWQGMLGAAAATGIVLMALSESFQKVVSNKWSKDNLKNIGTFLLMTLAVIPIGGALGLLANQSWGGMIAASISMGIALSALSDSFQKVLSKNWSDNNEKKIKTFFEMTLAISPLVFELAYLSSKPWGGMIAASISMGIALSALSDSFQKVLSKNWSDNNEKKIKTLFEMTLAISPLVLELAWLAYQPWEGLLAASVSMGIALSALSSSFQKVVSNKWSEDNLNQIGALLLMTIAIIPLVIEMGYLANQPWEGLLATAASLSVVLLAMSAAMGICAGIAKITGGTAAIEGMALLDLFIANFALVLAALGALFASDGAKLLLSEGAEVLKLLGQAIGEFVGAIIGGVLTGISGSLPQIGKDLSDFMDNLSGFIEGAKKINMKALLGVGFLSAMIIALTVAEVINGVVALIGRLVDYSLVDMAIELSNFMDELQPFIENSKNLKMESVLACERLAKMLLALTAADLISGIASFLGLGGDLPKFGRKLVKFGPYIKEFADTVQDIKPEAVQGAAAAAEIMANLAKKLPGTDGLVQKIFGEKSLADFGWELKRFGEKIVIFAETVKGITSESVQGAADAGSIMAELANNLPAANGLYNKIFGTKSLADFGAELEKFGAHIRVFVWQIRDIGTGKIENVQTVTSIMSELANNLPSVNSLWDKLFGGGKVTLDEFGAQLQKFGAQMVGFYNYIDDFNPELIDNVTDSFKNLIDLSNYIDDSNSNAIFNFATNLKNMGSDGVDNFVQTFKDGHSKAIAAMTTFLNKILETVQDRKPSFERKGSETVTKYLAGISERYESASIAGRGLANNVLIGCKELNDLFKNAGKNAGQGFIDGLNLNLDSAIKAGRDIAQAVYNSARKALDEHSPSKKMAEVGNYAGLGFVNKLMTFVAEASVTGREIGEATIDGISKSTNSIPTLIHDDLFDTDPVIRPVVDLSNIVESASEINKMFNEAISYASAKVNDVALGISTSRINATDQDVNDQKTSNGGNTYNFNQYNNSPKALSRLDIYRNTKNQFAQFVQATKTV